MERKRLKKERENTDFPKEDKILRKKEMMKKKVMLNLKVMPLKITLPKTSLF